MANLTAVQIVALAKVLNSSSDKSTLNAALDAVESGEHAFDFSVHLEGSFAKAQDCEAFPTVSVPFTVVIGLLIQRMGCTRESALALLSEVLPAAMAAKGKAKTAILEQTGVQESLDRFKGEVVGRMAPIAKRGAVKMGETLVEGLETPVKAVG